MTRNATLALVIGLACLTEDRTQGEQRALLEWAWRCDREHNQMTTGNRARREPDWRPLDLVGLVMETHNTEAAVQVKPPKGWAETWARWEREGGFAREHAAWAMA